MYTDELIIKPFLTYSLKTHKLIRSHMSQVYLGRFSSYSCDDVNNLLYQCKMNYLMHVIELISVFSVIEWGLMKIQLLSVMIQIHKGNYTYCIISTFSCEY